MIERLVETAVGSVPSGVLALDRALMGYLAQLVSNKTVDVDVCFATLLEAEDVRLRKDAVSALGRFAGIAGVRAELLKCLEDDDLGVQSATMNSLSSLLGRDETVRVALIEKLKDRDIGVRQSAVSALASLLGRDETVREALIERLDEDVFLVRLKVVEALLPFLSEEPAYWPRVRPWLGFEEFVLNRESLRQFPNMEWLRRFQSELIQVIGQHSARDSTVRAELLEQLTDVRASARVGAALALLASPEAPTPDVVARVLAAADDRRGLESYPARLTAASFLLNRNETSAESVELCLEALDYGTQPWEHLPASREVRKQAALVLGKLEPLESNERAYDKLLHVMKHDEDADVRDAAYGALVRLARARELGEVRGSAIIGSG